MWCNLKDQTRHLSTVSSFIYRFGAVSTSCGCEVVEMRPVGSLCPSPADPGVLRIDSRVQNCKFDRDDRFIEATDHIQGFLEVYEPGLYSNSGSKNDVSNRSNLRTSSCSLSRSNEALAPSPNTEARK